MEVAVSNRTAPDEEIDCNHCTCWPDAVAGSSCRCVRPCRNCVGEQKQVVANEAKIAKPTHEQRTAMLEMLDKCDADAWRATIAYCARELVHEQTFLAEIICRRAEKEAERTGNGHYPADHIASILESAGLRIEIADLKARGNDK